jgi:Flp pilus assembly protein TadG
MRPRRARPGASERGQAIPLLALLLIILIGLAGLVVDGGQLTMQYRASQNAADAAALAAADQITNGYTETQATTLATTVAQSNQIPAADLSIAYYDSSGAQTTTPASVASVTATVTHSFSTLFLPIVGINSGHVAAAATVTVTQGSASACVVCVMSTGNTSSALDLGGNGSLSLSGGNVSVASSSTSAISVGSNASLTVSSGNTYVVGGVSGSGSAHVSPTPLHVSSVSDPLSSVPVPTVTGAKTCCPSPLTPGIYSSISISGNSSVTMSSGTYVVTGGISVSGNGSLTGHNVTIYLACSGYPTACSSSGQSGAALSVTGNGSVDLTAPSYGTYQGLTIFSDRHNTSTLDFGGNGSTHFVGSVYALAGSADLEGNGADSSINSRVVANKLTIGGNGTITVSYTQSANYVVPDQLTLTN